MCVTFWPAIFASRLVRWLFHGPPLQLSVAGLLYCSIRLKSLVVLSTDGQEQLVFDL